ncbi:MAG: energy transducer TonB [Candidatus Marinimicrobia bacterium]|nr:energy transducer TonB [Candidatus Neomarinimicrobiota bacterium]
MAEHIHILKKRYPLTVRIMWLVSVFILIAAFLVFPRFLAEDENLQLQEIVIEQIDIPQTRQADSPPPPSRPSVPIESESEDLDEDITIAETELEDFEAWGDAPPPPTNTGPRVRFIPYDDPPVPKSPINPVYPEIAQEAGIEGTVIVQAFINAKGIVEETIILKGVPNTGLDEAAAEAIMRTRFKPAKQRDRPVGVWISIPVHFTLKN